jgi:hypothetical protein
MSSHESDYPLSLMLKYCLKNGISTKDFKLSATGNLSHLAYGDINDLKFAIFNNSLHIVVRSIYQNPTFKFVSVKELKRMDILEELLQ